MSSLNKIVGEIHATQKLLTPVSPIGKVLIRAKVGTRWLNHQLVEVFYVLGLCGNLFSTVEARKQGCETHFYVDGKCKVKINERVTGKVGSFK